MAGIGTQYVTQFMGHRIALEYARLGQVGTTIKLHQAVAENVGLRVLGREYYTLLASGDGPAPPAPAGQARESDLFAGLASLPP